MAMSANNPRKPRPPLDAARLDELALSYVGRFATSRAKLLTYLKRKLRERGWGGEGEPPLEGLADRLVRLGYIDDRAYALAKARSLTGRGYGGRRVGRRWILQGSQRKKRERRGAWSKPRQSNPHCALPGGGRWVRSPRTDRIRAAASASWRR